MKIYNKWKLSKAILKYKILNLVWKHIKLQMSKTKLKNKITAIMNTMHSWKCKKYK